MRRPTPLNLALWAVTAWALFLGALTGRVELFVVALPALVALVLGRRQVGDATHVIDHAISSERLHVGDEITVTVTITARARLPLVEVSEPPPPLTQLVEGQHRAVFTLAPGEQARWTYRLRAHGRQRLTLGHVHTRVWDHAGLSVSETEHRRTKSVAVYPNVMPLRRLPRPRATQTFVGNYVSRTLGEGLEPGEIRPFVAGDRMRHVNWRTSLRLGDLYVTQYHRERNADVVLMLDTLSEVGTPGTTTLDLSAAAAASLASAYLARRDRVGLIDYGGTIRWVRPGSGRAQSLRLFDSLLQAAVLFTYVTKDLALVPRRVLPPHALVIALSPLLDRRFVKAIRDLAARRFDLVVLAISPVAVTRGVLAASASVDLACRLWSLEWRARTDELRRNGLRVIEWISLDSLQPALAMLDQRRHRMALIG